MASQKQTELINLWKSRGYKVVNLIVTNSNGITDLMALKDGEAIFIESKEDGDTVKALQRFRMGELTAMGFTCYVNEELFTDWKIRNGFE